MAQALLRSFVRNLLGTLLGVVLIGAGNLLLGATWPEVRAEIPEYLLVAVTVAALLTAYQTWKANRTPRAE